MRNVALDNEKTSGVIGATMLKLVGKLSVIGALKMASCILSETRLGMFSISRKRGRVYENGLASILRRLKIDVLEIVVHWAVTQRLRSILCHMFVNSLGAVVSKTCILTISSR